MSLSAHHLFHMDNLTCAASSYLTPASQSTRLTLPDLNAHVPPFLLSDHRFLSLFEKAVKENGSCIGQLGFFEDGAIAAVAVLCEVVEWRRLDVGVHVRLRAVSRISVKALTQLDPFVLVSGAEYLDEGGGAKAAAGDTVARLVEKLYEAHSEIVDLSLKLDAAVPEQEGAGLASTETEIEWGHEKGNYRDCVRTPLKEQVAQYKQCLSEGRFLEEDGPGDDEFMWKLADAESEEVQLLSFVALAGMDPEVRLWALDQNSTVERIEKGLEILTERKNILAAKMALSSIKFD
jgi:hypothetical protein